VRCDGTRVSSLFTADIRCAVSASAADAWARSASNSASFCSAACFSRDADTTRFA
jgi:hypothetical protein